MSPSAGCEGKQGAVDPVLLQTNGISRSYRRREVLAPLDCELKPGQRLCLLGPNGAGKTTLMSLMACVLAPTHGSVRVGECVVHTYADAREARKLIGFLPQSPSWIPSFSARDMVEYSAWLKGVPRGQRRRRAMDVLEQMGLADVATRRMREMSGGMIQRTCLAATLVARPRVLLLDEPTVGLDPAQRLDFRRMIARLADVAVVLSTHLVEDVSVIAGDIMVLDRGRVVFRGSPGHLQEAGCEGDPGDTPMERGYMSVLSESGKAFS